METLILRRRDWRQVGPLLRNSVRLLPAGGKGRPQKVIIGDRDGVVTVMGVQRGEPTIKCRLTRRGKGVSGVVVGSLSHTKRAYYSTGQDVRGVTTKGKETFTFTVPTLTDDIRTFSVIEGPGCALDLYVAGEFVYAHFQGRNEVDFLLVKDRIHNMALAVVEANASSPNVILACQDRVVRILRGSSVLAEARTDGPVLVVVPVPDNTFMRDKDETHEAMQAIMYGTQNGTLGHFLTNGPSVLPTFTIPPRTERSGGVQCLEFYDMTGDGIVDLLVGRDDGIIEVFSGFSIRVGTPHTVFSTSINESVMSLSPGHLSSSTYPEIVVGSFSGRILSFTSEPPVQTQDPPEGGGGGGVASLIERAGIPMGRLGADRKGSGNEGPGAKKLKALQAEVEKLRLSVVREREVHSKVADTLLSASPMYKVNDKFVMNAKDGTYTLSVETDVPLDLLALQSDVMVEVVEVSDNTAILNQCPADPQNGNVWLATCRCQEPIKQISIRLRTEEGCHGKILAYIIPRRAPKTAQTLSYTIKPLCLHESLPELPNDGRSMGKLTLTGGFSLADMHSWVQNCLPGAPTRLMTEEAILAFTSTITGTILSCSYRRGEATFQSDSPSTLVILKDAVTREATTRKIRVNAAVSFPDECVGEVLDRIRPLLQHQVTLGEQASLLPVLREIQVQEGDVNFLAPDLLEILDNGASLEAAAKQQPRILASLHGIICSLYVDKNKLRGVDLRRNLSHLHTLLDRNEWDAIVEFIQAGP